MVIHKVRAAFATAVLTAVFAALASPGQGNPNSLSLNVNPPSLFVRPGESVHIDMDVSDLAQRVNGCQAMVGFSSFFLSASAGCVEPGGGAWDQLIYSSWDVGAGVPGEIDTAIGVNAQGSVGTDADGTVAKITLTAGSNEGETQVVFRPDAGDTESTFLSDTTGSPVWPYKVDSQTIVIDGTAPTVTVLQPNGGETVLGGHPYEITWTAADAHFGPQAIGIECSADNGLTWQTVAVDEANDGAYTWNVPPSIDTTTALVRVTATDLAGNGVSDTSDGVFTIRASNRLALNVGPPSLFVRPGEDVLIDMDITNLAQKVNGCQAMLGFSSYYLTAAAGCVQPGGGAWDQLIYNSWDIGSGVPGEIDTAIGVDAQGHVGTDADGTIAKITLTAGANEGETQIVFRPDNGETESTFLSDMTGSAVWPYKVDSQTVVIDGTPPSVTVLQPNGGEVLLGGQSYQILWTASDPHLGADPITIDYSADNGMTWVPIATGEANDGVHDWTVPLIDTAFARVRVTAVDLAGNFGSDMSDETFVIDTSPPALNIASAAQAATESPFNAPGFAYKKIASGGPRTLSGASFSPDGGKVVYIDRSIGLWADYYIKVIDRATGVVTPIAGDMRNGSGQNGFYAYLMPYFSADGRKISWTRQFFDIPNQVLVYDIDSNTGRAYQFVNQQIPPDVANSDFMGSCTDRWVAWDWNQSTWESDLHTYIANLVGPSWYWQQWDNLTNTTSHAEYEPDSDRAGQRIVYWSGRTASEVKDTVHMLTWNGFTWVKDLGFTPIVGANWPHWSADETEIAVAWYSGNPGLGRGDLYIHDTAGNFKFDLTGPAVTTNIYRQSFGFNAAVGPAGAGREYIFVSDASNMQGGTDVWIARATPELLYSYRTSPDDVAVQGDVHIKVTAGDTGAGLAGPPTVQVTDPGGNPMPVSYLGQSPVGTFNYSVTVTSSTPNGMATVTASVTDRAGRVSNDIDYFDINKNRITGTLSCGTLSPTYYTFSRGVTFAATSSSGALLKTWTRMVTFTNNPVTRTASALYALDGAPASTARLSAKAVFSLRKRQSVTLDSNGQGVVNFSLLPGDLDGSNTVNTLDYSIMKGKWLSTDTLADINGDGMVQTLDYSIMKSNWYRTGDAQ